MAGFWLAMWKGLSRLSNACMNKYVESGPQEKWRGIDRGGLGGSTDSSGE